MIGQIDEISMSIEIVCEIASAHEGDIDNLYQLLIEAEKSGSDWVKLQIYQFEKLVANDNEKFADLKIIEICQADWLKVLDFSETLEVKLIIEAFDYESFVKVKNHTAIKGFKIPTSDLLDSKFVNEIFSQKKIVFIAVGGTKLTELDAVMETAKKYPATEVVLLHGFQNFPTRLGDSLLNKIPSLIKRYDCRVGFADHVDANDTEISRCLPAMAVAAGAQVIEKHLTLDRGKKGYDYYSALNPNEFISFVNYIKKMTESLGSGDLKSLSKAELSYRDNMKKFGVATKDLNIGSFLKSGDLAFRRTIEPGLTHTDLTKLKNNKICRFVKKGRIISLDDFE